jgi:hypothetical protein
MNHDNLVKVLKVAKMGRLSKKAAGKGARIMRMKRNAASGLFYLVVNHP